MLDINTHVRAALRPTTTTVSRAQMILCALGTGIPLLVGDVRGELGLAIYGALTAYLLTAFDHVGSFAHRLGSTTLMASLLALGFAIGLACRGQAEVFALALFVSAYWIGLISDRGGEVERALLFGLLQVVIAVSANASIDAHAEALFVYMGFGWLTVVICILIQHTLWPDPAGTYVRLREAFYQSRPFTRSRARHVHALVYASAALAALFVAWRFHFERGYWIIITVLLILKPDRTQSFYRSFQRLFGTCLGVAASIAVIYSVRATLPILGLTAACAYFVPWAMKRNYWLVSLLISMIVIFLLDLPSVQTGDAHTPLLRLEATAIGSAIALAGVAMTMLIDRAWLRRASVPDQ